jgi:hypothetical protein
MRKKRSVWLIACCLWRIHLRLLYKLDSTDSYSYTTPTLNWLYVYKDFILLALSLIQLVFYLDLILSSTQSQFKLNSLSWSSLTQTQLNLTSLSWSFSWLGLHVPPLQLGLAILVSSLTWPLLILMFPCLSKPSPKAQESSLNLPGLLTQIAYPINLPRITWALPERLTRPPYPGSTRVLTRALPKHLTRLCTPYPTLLNCLTQLGNSLLALSKVFYVSR